MAQAFPTAAVSPRPIYASKLMSQEPEADLRHGRHSGERALSPIPESAGLAMKPKRHEMKRPQHRSSHAALPAYRQPRGLRQMACGDEDNCRKTGGVMWQSSA